MKAISDKLEAIAIELGADYMRASSLQDSNIQVHYKSVDVPIIMYVGFGDISSSYEGAEPLQEVACEIYVLTKAPTVDDTQLALDDVMDSLNQLSADIVYKFKGVRDTLEFSLQGVSLLDDILVGYLMEVNFIIEGKLCLA